MHDFANNENVRFSSKSCKNSHLEIIGIGLEAIKSQTKYFILTENCNHLTSNACDSKKQSKSLQNVSIVISSIAGSIALISKNPKTRKIATRVAVAGLGIATFDAIR